MHKAKLLLSLCLLCGFFLSAYADGKFENIDSGWKFIEKDVVGAEQVNFNDKSWESVNLPHDWDIYHSPKANAPTGNDGGYYPGGIGWYRKTLTNVKYSAGKTFRLHFEGVYQRSKVYVNGELVGTHGYGFTPYYIYITPYVKKISNGKKGGSITIAVRVDNSAQPNCRWYSGSGIYRHVWLETLDDNGVDDPTKVFVRTEKIYGMSADGTHADSATVRVTYGAESQPQIDEIRTFRNIKLWSPEHPMLYDVKVGDLIIKHGFRTIAYDAKDGFKLNGQRILLNGACVHHDDGLLGAMAYDAAEIRKVRLMKEAGFNLIRTSHNPTTRAFLDACDSIGMMVIDEDFDGWRSKKTAHDYHEMIDSCYKEDIAALVLRDRNHPSIICWSIGNEVIERKELRVVYTAKLFKSEILRYDNTRPVTEALCSWDNDWEIFDPHAEVLDIVGYNYMMHKHESDHKRCPERVMWQTESYPREAFKNWTRTNDYNYIIGDIVWTGLDYLGESGIGQFYYPGEPKGEHYQGKHFPFHGAYCGDVDITGWRKPISHYRSMLYNDTESKDIYLSVREPDGYKGKISETLWSVWPTWESWNWSGWEGKKIEAEIYTKAPAVNLYLNDKLIATQKVDRSTEYKAVIPINYEPGTLRAVAVDASGNEGKSAVLTTSGKAVRFRLTPDRKLIKADGEDLCYITVEAVDEKGNIVPDADVAADVNVNGQGVFMASGSASMKDLEPLTSHHFTTYHGRAMIVVRSTKKAGTINISVSGADISKSATKVISKK